MQLGQLSEMSEIPKRLRGALIRQGLGHSRPPPTSSGRTHSQGPVGQRSDPRLLNSSRDFYLDTSHRCPVSPEVSVLTCDVGTNREPYEHSHSRRPVLTTHGRRAAHYATSAARLKGLKEAPVCGPQAGSYETYRICL